MSHQLRVRPDKIGSVCAPFALPPYLTVGSEPVSGEGVAVIGRVLEVARTYQELELRSGRPALLVPGNLIVGVLGARAALRGFCGRVPSRAARGDVLQLLNKGGVIGVSEGATVGLGVPTQLEIVGVPLRQGQPLRLSDYALEPVSKLPPKLPPVLAVAATCMHAGKTTAAGVVIRHLVGRGLVVHAGKATGVAAAADLLSFADNGAAETLSFLQAGLPSTCYHDDVPQITRTLLAHLAHGGPDVIVLELGDGLLGAYGVDAILDDPGLAGCFTGALVAANDVIGGYAVGQVLKERGVKVAAVTGPATDNTAGRLKLNALGLAAANVHQQASELCRMVERCLGLPADPADPEVLEEAEQ